MTPHTRVAVVTGAGTGIGRAAALALLEDGYLVVLAGRRPEKLEETARSSEDAASRTLVVPTDVTDPVAVRALFDRTREAFGRLDVLFNNAGIVVPGVPMEDLDYDVWKRVVDVNLNGMFLCAQQAIRLMKSQDPRGGRIINNGSISAQVPRPHSAPYTATKHGVTGLTKCISLDGRAFDIACGQIDIGNAESAMAAPMTRGVPQANGSVAMAAPMTRGVPQANGSVAAEPVIDVAHVARAVIYMANLPLDANVQFMTLMATKMPFVGRG
jgi:NAD(P)-dependent dehydrogenase (short-subunit alcohol dehydrogenase family)